MTELPATEWIQYEADGPYFVRCPQHRGWTELLSAQVNPDGSIQGHCECAHPECGWVADVHLLLAIEQPMPEGGVVELGVSDDSGDVKEAVL